MPRCNAIRDRACRIAVVALAAALAAAACDTDARYSRITDPSGANAAVAISMDFTKTAKLPSGFSAAGVGRVFVFGNEIRLDADNLTRPPEGFVYKLFLANAATSTFAEVGPLTGPAPQYADLSSADTQTQEPLVTDRLITKAAVRNIQGTFDFSEFAEFWVVLMPKAGADAPEAIAAKGAVPPALQD